MLLLRIGIASQVIDDITGTFPGIIDHDKDTLGEIANLRRTVPLLLLAHHQHSDEVASLLAADAPLSDKDAQRLRTALWDSDVPAGSLALGRTLLADVTTRLDDLTLGIAAHDYLRDLVTYRLTASLNRLERSLRAIT